MSRRFHMQECLIRRASYVTLHATTKEALMPTTPNSPVSTSAVDRLVLGATSVRGTEPSNYGGVPTCFDAEASSYASLEFSCFEAEASSYASMEFSCFSAE